MNKKETLNYLTNTFDLTENDIIYEDDSSSDMIRIIEMEHTLYQLYLKKENSLNDMEKEDFNRIKKLLLNTNHLKFKI